MIVNWIEVTNIKSFGAKTRVNLNQDLNFVVGPNGSGKTTVFQLLSSCLKTLVPFYTGRNSTDGVNQIQKYRLDKQLLNLALPKNYEMQDEEQEIMIEFDISKSKKDLVNELKEYSKLFFQEKVTLDDNYRLDTLNVGEELENALAYFEANTVTKYQLTFRINANQLSIVDDPGTQEIVAILDKLELFRQLHLYIYRKGVDTAVIKRGFQIIHMIPERQYTFPEEVQLNRDNAQEYHNQSSHNQTSGLMDTVFGINYSFSYMQQTLSRVSEEVVNNKWNKSKKNPLEDNEELIQIKKTIRKLLDLDFVVDIPGSPYENMKFRFKKDGAVVLFSHLSTGEKALIDFVFALFNPDITNSFIIIDEAELHLHGNMQDVLVNLLTGQKTSSTNQYFVSTHSPNMINRLTISSVVRFYKQNRFSKCINFRKEFAKKAEYDIVRLINSQNNEKVFFADKVILVEGIKDRVFVEALVKSVGTRNSIIEVIDVGGKSNLKFYKGYLDDIQLETLAVADFDFLPDIENEEMPKYCETNEVKIGRKLTEKMNTDKLSLIKAVQVFIDTDDKIGLQEVVAYIRSNYTSLKSSITPQEVKEVAKLIEKQKDVDIFIHSRAFLKKLPGYTGEIEDYFRHLTPRIEGNFENLILFLSKPKFLNTMLKKMPKTSVIDLFDLMAHIFNADAAKVITLANSRAPLTVRTNKILTLFRNS